MTKELEDTLKLIQNKMETSGGHSVFIPLSVFPWYHERNGQLTKLHNGGYVTKPRFSGNGVEISLTADGLDYLNKQSGMIRFNSINENMCCPLCGYPAKVIQVPAARDWGELHCENCLTFSIRADALVEASDLYLVSGFVRHHQPHMMTVQCHDRKSIAEITATPIPRNEQMRSLLFHYYQKMSEYGQLVAFDPYPAIAYTSDETDLHELIDEGIACGYLIMQNDMVSVTEAGKAYIDEQNSIKELVKPDRPSVFISYNWGCDEIVNDLEEKLKPYAEVKRDKNSVKPWGDLVEFMNSIRYQDFAVLVISDAYLKSEACLYEVMQLMKDEHWDNRVMYVVTEDAKVYKPIDQIQYIKHWQNECETLESALKDSDSAATAGVAEELKKFRLIHLNIGSFMEKVKRANNPDMNVVIEKIVDRVKRVNR